MIGYGSHQASPAQHEYMMPIITSSRFSILRSNFVIIHWSLVPILLDGTWKNLCLTTYYLWNQVILQLGVGSSTFLGIILPNSQPDGRRRAKSFPFSDFVTKDRMQNPDLVHLSTYHAIWGRVTCFFPLILILTRHGHLYQLFCNQILNSTLILNCNKLFNFLCSMWTLLWLHDYCYQYSYSGVWFRHELLDQLKLRCELFCESPTSKFSRNNRSRSIQFPPQVVRLS